MWTALFGSLFALLLSGVWIGAALGITAIIVLHFWGVGINLLGSAVWDAVNIYALTTLPGFIFMGQVIEASGISGRIYENVSPLMARLPGKLLQSNILISAMFAAVLGSSSANAAIVGSVAIPELRKRKYDEQLLLGSVCVGGTLGLLIPPSGAFIIYGVMANASIAALFAAGTIPGILLAMGFMLYIGIKGILTPTIAPAGEKGLPFKATSLALIRVWPLVVLMVICILPIYLGLCTPVEGAGMGSVGAIIIGRVFGKLDWRAIKVCLSKATETSVIIFFLIIGASLLSVSASTIGLPRAIIEWVKDLPLSPVAILILIYVMYIVMGCFLDGISMMLVTLPFIVPVITSLGFDPVWFGVQTVLVIEIGLVTPPVGLNLFVVQGIAGSETSLADIFKGSFPFLVITFAMMILLTVFPKIATLLPQLIGL